MRYSLKESPEFEEARKAGEVHTGVPIKRIFTVYPRETILSILAMTGPLFMQGLMAVFAVPHVVEQGVVDRQTALMMLTASAAVHVFAIPTVAHLADRFGRVRVMLTGAVIGIALVFPMFAAFESNTVWIVGVGFMLGNPIIQASMYGPVGSFLADKYEPQDRYTGVSMAYQGASVLGGGLAPLISTTLVELPNGWGSSNIALYFIFLTIIAAIAVYFVEKNPKQPKTRMVVSSDPV